MYISLRRKIESRIPPRGHRLLGHRDGRVNYDRGKTNCRERRCPQSGDGMGKERKSTQDTGCCHFWKLPGELRNMIYGYVLTLESPTCAIYTGRKIRRVNKLQYVCRQLWQETLGLHLQLNVLSTKRTFVSNTLISLLPLQHLELRFVRKLIIYDETLLNDGPFRYPVHPARLAYLCGIGQQLRTGQQITIMGHGGCAYYYPIYLFCQCYPHAQVMVRSNFFEIGTLGRSLRSYYDSLSFAANAFPVLLNLMVYIILMQLTFPSTGRKLSSLTPRERRALDDCVRAVSEEAPKIARECEQLDNFRWFPMDNMQHEETLSLILRMPCEYSEEQITERVTW